MTKVSIIEREKKRLYLINKYSNKLKNLKNLIKNNNISNFDKYSIRLKIQDIPRNANPTRKRNRCFITGKSRGFFRRFGLSRNMIRDLAFKGDIPGIIKAS